MRVKLVDLKSLRTFSDVRSLFSFSNLLIFFNQHHGVDRGKNCTTLEHCVAASGCFRWQLENDFAVPELQCEGAHAAFVDHHQLAAPHFCVGFESPSMLFGSIEPLLWPLLVQWLRAPPAADFVDALTPIFARMTSENHILPRNLIFFFLWIVDATAFLRRERASSAATRQALRALFDRYDGAAAFGDGAAARGIVRALMRRLIATAATRCQSRYC